MVDNVFLINLVISFMNNELYYYKKRKRDIVETLENNTLLTVINVICDVSCRRNCQLLAHARV